MTFSYDPTIPNPPNDPANDVGTMQTNAGSISSIIAVDHVGFNVAGGGQHKQVTFNSNNIPVLPTSPPVLFTNTVGALSQLFYYSGSAAQASAQYVQAASGSTFTLGGILIKWGSGTLSAPYSATGTAVTFTSPFLNNCWAVIASTQDAGTGTTANTFAYARSFTTSGFNILITLRTSAAQPGAGSVNYTYIAIGD